MAFGNAIRTNTKRIIYVLLSSRRRPAIPLCRIKHTHHQHVSDVASSRRRTQTTDALEPNVVVPVHTTPSPLNLFAHARRSQYLRGIIFMAFAFQQPAREWDETPPHQFSRTLGIIPRGRCVATTPSAISTMASLIENVDADWSANNLAMFFVYHTIFIHI